MATYRVVNGRNVRTFDPNLASKLSSQPNTGGAERALVNQQSLRATDEQYSEILKNQQANAVAKRNAAAAAETTGVSLADRSRFKQAELNKQTQNDTSIVNQLKERLPVIQKDSILQTVNRLPSSRASLDQPVIEKGKTVILPNAVVDDRQKEIDLMVKAAKNEPYNDDDLKYLADKELTKRDSVSQTSSPVTNFSAPIGGQGFTPLTTEQVLQLSPEQLQAYKKEAFNANVQNQMNTLNQGGEMISNFFQNKEDQIQDKIEDTRTAEQQQIDEQMAQFEADQRAQAEIAKQSVQETAAEDMDYLKRLQARRGNVRSSSGESAIMKASAKTQQLVDGIERLTNSTITDQKVKLLDKMDAKISKLEDRLETVQDARTQTELNNAIEQQKTYVTLMAQDPTNPENMIKAAEAMKAKQIEDNKELRKEARENFQFMVTNFGSQAFEEMSDEEITNYANNAGLDPAMLKNIGATLKEQEQYWEEAKYAMDKEYDWAKTQADQAFTERLADKNYQNDLNKLGIQFDNSLGLEAFRSELDAKKYANIGYGAVAANATGIVNNGAGLIMNDGSQFSPQLANAAPVGSRKVDPKNGLVGQCAYEAGKMVMKPDGSGDMVYGMDLQDKKNNLAKYVKNGQAFYGGNGQAKVGNSLITNESKLWGHVAVINKVLPNGDYVISEYNRAGKQEFNNSRIVKKDAPFILGVIDTKPNAKYQVAKDIQNLAADIRKKDPLVGVALQSLGASTTLGKVVTSMTDGFAQNAINAPAQNTLVNQDNIQQALEQGLIDEQGNELSDERMNVRSGAMTLDKETLDILKKYKPQDYATYQADLAYANKNKQQEKEIASPTELRQVRNEYNKIAAVSNESMKYANQLDTTWKNYKAGKVDKGTADNALIMLFSKMLDPGSVVREGEFDRVIAGQPLLTYAQNLVSSKATGGYALDDNTRQQLVSLANEFAKAQSAKMQYTKNFYEKEAEYLGVEPSRITGAYDFSMPTQLVSVRGPDGQIYSMTKEDTEKAELEGGHII